MKKSLFVIFNFILFWLNAQKMQDVIFQTTDGRRYALKTFTQTNTTTYGVGALLAPTITVKQDGVTNPTATATNPILSNQTQPIIPVYFSQILYCDPALTTPNVLYKFSTPYLVQQNIPYGRNTFALKMAPHCQTISNAVSAYPPFAIGLDYISVAFSGTIINRGYQNVAFSSRDFIDIIYQGATASTTISFECTFDNAAYCAQYTGPFPVGAWRSTTMNDFINLAKIGIPSPIAGDITGVSEFLYFELVK